MNTPPPEYAPHTVARPDLAFHGRTYTEDDINGVPCTPRPQVVAPAPLGSDYASPTDGDAPLSVLLRTVDFAAWKHQSQRRKDLDQTPYINHPIAVANLLSQCGVTDIRVLQAAILHDTVEDTHTTVDEIARTFGPEVAAIVAECTDDVSLDGPERKAEQLRTAPLKSIQAQQVKLADKLHNLESIRRSPPVGWGVRRIQAYFVWAKQVTDVCKPACPPLSARLEHLYTTAHTRVNGEYFPCHPGVCGPLTEEEKGRVDSRFIKCPEGAKPNPHPIFF